MVSRCSRYNSRGVTTTIRLIFIAVVLSLQLAAQLSSNVSIVTSGLDNPRGLKFGPDRNLYVAEGGQGGEQSTVGICTQVPAPIGPYTGGHTARISRIDSAGNRTTVVDGLPSSQTAPESGGLVSGVADVAFVGTTLYGLLAGAGCSHGVADVPNGVFRVNSDGTWTLVANLSEFIMAHPVANPEPDDFEPDGTWYSMQAIRGNLYVLEPNHGELDRVSPTTGAVQRVADISATQGHIVPTALAYHGIFYVGNLNTFPVVPGSSKVLRITPGGVVHQDTTGLTTVVALVFDNRDRLYVLETSTAPGPPTPGTGMVVRLNPNGSKEVIATGLTFPTGMTMGPDGMLYVSNYGFGFPPGAGQVVRIAVTM